MSLPLEVLNLHKQYPGAASEAVKGVSFDVRGGEIFGLLGPNGAGKTTLISTITTLEKPSSGTVKVFGVDVTQDPMFTKRQIGVVHQEVINSGFFDVEEILTFHSGYYGLTKNKERIHFLLNKLALFEHRKKKVKQLSGGMKRRLMIAKALVHNPKMLLLDEPTAGVDIKLREDLWVFVQELKKEGMSILLTTHYLEEAEQLCDRVAIINLGKCVTVGDTKEIIRQYTHKRILLSLTEHFEIKSKYLLTALGKEYSFVVPQDKTLGDFFNEVGVPIHLVRDVQIKEGDLEAAFLHIVTKKEEQVQP
ncbi:MAG: ABC transporter ATP-binding protein [Bdellovibrio sp.]|nr:ABC transporter ATP-binding protein [Bdellovibrio sp.]